MFQESKECQNFRKTNISYLLIRIQVFSCEFCEIFKNTFLTEHCRTTASLNDFLLVIRLARHVEFTKQSKINTTMIKNDKNEMTTLIHIFTYFLTYALIYLLACLFHHLSFINYSICLVTSSLNQKRHDFFLFFGGSFVQVLHIRCSHQKCSVKKGFLKNFAKFAGKHLRHCLFFNKVADLYLQFH